MVVMKKWKMLFLLPLIFLSVVLRGLYNNALSQAPKNILFAGTAKTKITPGVPIPMSGYGGRNDPFKGVHDDLFARVIIISNGVNKALLVTTDLIGISNSIWEETTKRITQETGIKKEYILLSAVHN